MEEGGFIDCCVILIRHPDIPQAERGMSMMTHDDSWWLMMTYWRWDMVMWLLCAGARLKHETEILKAAAEVAKGPINAVHVRHFSTA